MSIAYSPDRLRLPESLQDQLHQFRRRVWTIKLIEAAAASLFGILAAYLFMFGLDRVWETPDWARLTLFVAAAIGCASIPVALYRWVWRNRRLEQLARLLARKHPRVGDQLLGIIELVRNDFEQARSRALCEAAVREVAEDARKRDFRDAVPNPRHALWLGIAAVPALVAAGLLGLVPAAATNAWQRLAAPWLHTPRYTFTRFDQLPERLVVAHGEPFSLPVRLSDSTVWHPQQARATLGRQRPVTATLQNGVYTFEFPSQIDAGSLEVTIGDRSERMRIEPTLRPEITALTANVTLPAYLKRPEPIHKDVRGGNVSLVNGSKATFTATASRPLSDGRVDAESRSVAGSSFSTEPVEVKGSRVLSFSWRDQFGLAGKEAFGLTITGRDDEAPTIACEDLPRQKVILDTELLSFKVRAQDDFGVKRIGMEWHGIEDPIVKSPANGEKIIAAGGPDKDNLEVSGTFSAKSLGIEPQPVNVRLFAEDYLPGRERVYSATYTFYVLTAEQHAIWITEQLSKWHRQSLEVRDREMQLFAVNKQLRDLAADELDKPENRKRIESQASAERANGRRLSGLVGSGEELIRQAMRNPEFAIGHLEKWAEMLAILKDISGSRMPTVADLLKQAAQAPQSPGNPPNNKSMMAGQIRDASAGKPSEAKPGEARPPSAIPTVADRESSQQPPDPSAAEQPASKSKPKDPRLTLPVTTLAGKPSTAKPEEEKPAPTAVEEAVAKQQDLLAEFEKIADELNRVLANLEGSTLLKRLKAAARLQDKIAGRISDQVSQVFGVAARSVEPVPSKVLDEMGQQESKASQDISHIMDDMRAYFERRRFQRFKAVLDEMRQQDVVGAIRQIGDDVKTENGLSMSQCEYWSDALDRWAEDLVDAGKSGKCDAKSKSSLPPALVLEAMMILEAEVNLRQETRVAQQARPALPTTEFATQAGKLSTTQKGLGDRVEKLTNDIRALPDSETEFGTEIRLLSQVGAVMAEATGILATPETGDPAIAAETEAIELLLQSKRINPKGGGGGGSNPGGGGKGSTNDSALALIGGGVNDKEVREDHGIAQATGDSGPVLPEEFRAGLDEYFNRLEKPGR